MLELRYIIYFFNDMPLYLSDLVNEQSVIYQRKDIWNSYAIAAWCGMSKGDWLDHIVNGHKIAVYVSRLLYEKK